jgi:type IV secretion system protein VirD4
VDNENNRFGSARWATSQDIKRAGLFDPPEDDRRPAPFLGFVDQQPTYLVGDAPLITFAGAGGGKLTGSAAYNVCGNRHQRRCWKKLRRKIVLDLRGELAAISIHMQAVHGQHAYCVNPFGMHGLPQHRVNPWDMLKKGSPTLHADTKHLIADLIPSAHGNEKFFTDTGRNWSEALAKNWIDQHGAITLPAFYDLVTAIDDPSAWEVVAESMLNSGDGHVRSVAAQMDYKRDRAPKEYSAVIATIQQYIGFLSDPVIRQTLSGSDFSLAVLCEHDCTVYLIVPAEYLNQLAPMMRAIFGAAMIYKYRQPSAPVVTFLIDEAAQLGKFESLLNGYSFGRGMGVRMWSFWQNPGQITRNFGQDALASFVGSSQVRQFFGVRDIDTAKIVSAMLGQQTLEYDDPLAQDAARRNMYQAISALLNGADPMEAGRAFGQYRRAAVHRSQQARALMTPDEVMNMPEDKQILFVSGLNLRPILADKYPYYTRPEMAGAYMPNPYHPPYDRVPIAGHARKWARVIRERVPVRYAHLPQYQSGEWAYVEGFRPHV